MNWWFAGLGFANSGSCQGLSRAGYQKLAILRFDPFEKEAEVRLAKFYIPIAKQRGVLVTVGALPCYAHHCTG